MNIKTGMGGVQCTCGAPHPAGLERVVGSFYQQDSEDIEAQRMVPGSSKRGTQCSSPRGGDDEGGPVQSVAGAEVADGVSCVEVAFALRVRNEAPGGAPALMFMPKQKPKSEQTNKRSNQQTTFTLIAFQLSSNGDFINRDEKPLSKYHATIGANKQDAT